MKRITRWNVLHSIFQLSLLWAVACWASAPIAQAQSAASQAESSKSPSGQSQTAPAESQHDSAIPMHQPASTYTKASATQEVAPKNSSAPTVAPAMRENRSIAHELALLKKMIRPAKPQRPLPLVLFLIGLAILVISGGLGILALLLLGTAFPIGVLTLFLCAVFGLTGLLGILLMISALIMAFAAGKKPKQAAPPSN